MENNLMYDDLGEVEIADADYDLVNKIALCFEPKWIHGSPSPDWCKILIENKFVVAPDLQYAAKLIALHLQKYGK